MIIQLKKVISGGQTGVDRTALECAVKLGLRTGGTAPRGFLTESGYDPTLASFGLVEHLSPHYSARTWRNVEDAEVTVWFGHTSPGYRCTREAAYSLGRPFKEFSGQGGGILGFLSWAEEFRVMNVAGNRRSINPHASVLVRAAFAALRPHV